jgi:hypothetical protein
MPYLNNLTKLLLPIVFFSRKLTATQQCYSMTKIELLAIVENLEEFDGMMWGK